MGSVEVADIFTNTLIFLTSTSPESDSIEPFYYNTSGLYLMSDPVPRSGRISNVMAFGYLREEDVLDLFLANIDVESIDSENVNFTTLPIAYVVVYRPDFLQNVYTLVHGPEALTYKFEPGIILVDWEVEEGDRIGVILPERCETAENFDYPMVCPAKLNLRVMDGRCLSALYALLSLEDDVSRIEMNEFVEVYVDLNMAVSISLTEQQNGRLGTFNCNYSNEQNNYNDNDKLQEWQRSLLLLSF